MKEALENRTIHGAEEAFFEVLGYIHDDAIGILVQPPDAVLVEARGSRYDWYDRS